MQFFSHQATDKKKLEQVNKRGLRAVFCDWNLAYEDLLKRANLCSLYNMRLQDIAIFMYKVKHRLLPSNILDLFSGTPSWYNLRNSDFHISRFNSVHYGKHSLRYFGPYLWSKLGHSDRQMPTLTSFVSNIRRKDLANLVSNYVCTGNCVKCV